MRDRIGRRSDLVSRGWSTRRGHISIPDPTNIFFYSYIKPLEKNMYSNNTGSSRVGWGESTEPCSDGWYGLAEPYLDG